MKEVVCSFCGEREFVTYKQNKSYSGLKPLKSILGTGLELHHDICKNCGTVVRSYVNDLDKLK